jgi:hypothetical protein
MIVYCQLPNGTPNSVQVRPAIVPLQPASVARSGLPVSASYRVTM